MIRGIILKSVRETWVTTLLFGLGLFTMMAAVTAIIPQFQDSMTDVMQAMPFVRTIISSLFGVDPDEELTAQLMQSLLWIHPIVLTLTWAHTIVICTRVPAGEIDRGTIDLLLGLPISRRGVYIGETIVWAASGFVFLMFGELGHLTAQAMISVDDPPQMLDTIRIMTNLYALYLAVGGLALLCS